MWMMIAGNMSQSDALFSSGVRDGEECRYRGSYSYSANVALLAEMSTRLDSCTLV